MRHLLFFMLLIASGYSLAAQPRIHAHNDYQQARPLTNALRNRVYSIEADVYAGNNSLLVAHSKEDIRASHTLAAQYLQPIIRLFKKHKGRISRHKTYAPLLLIDSKDAGAAVIAELVKETAAHPSIFNRQINALAVQLVISGNRGAVATWALYPSHIFFDGRPYEVYDSAELLRVAFISDNYSNYVSKQDSTSRIAALVKKVHGMGKLLRLWGIPDTATSWQQLQLLGVDIINTDKVGECRKLFLTQRK